MIKIGVTSRVGRGKEGKSKWAREGDQVPYHDPLASDLLALHASSFPFPSRSDAYQEG